MLGLARHGSPAKFRLSRDDLLAAFIVFLLVSATSLPAVIPFIMIGSADLALRASNFLLIALLFLTGCAWARFSDAKPLNAGITMTCLGLVLVGDCNRSWGLGYGTSRHAIARDGNHAAIGLGISPAIAS